MALAFDPVFHPPSAYEAVNEMNGFSRAGAARLAKKIEDYWAERGRHVQTALVEEGFSPVTRQKRYDIRSDMLNGWPRKARA